MAPFRLVVASLVFSVCMPAFAAKPCTDRSKECGAKLFDAGVKAFQAGSYETALEHFREAHAIAKLPVVTFNLALAEDKLGQYESALSHLDEVLGDSSTSKATREKAEAERERISRSFAVIAGELTGAKDIQVEIDGKAVPLQNGAVRVRPGSRSVRVVADGTERLSRSVRVEAGERLVLHIERTRELVVESDGEKPASAPAEKDEPQKSSGVSPAWFFLAAGATVVLGGITVWSGLDTVSAKNDLDDDRPTLTIAEEQQRIDEGHAKETRTNVFLVATGVGVVATAGLGLFVVSWGKGKNDNVAVGLNGSVASVSGRF